MRFGRPLAALFLASVALVVALVASGAVGTATTAPSPVSLQERLIQTVRSVSPSVVQIQSGGGLGSGVVYDRKGHIVTNAHVVGGAGTFRITLASGRELSGELVGRFAPEDLAVIRIDADGLKPLPLEKSKNVRVGEFALAIGNPLGLRSSVTDGIVSAVARAVTEPNGALLPNVVQTSAPINPGNSGGALVDLEGKLIGIPTIGVPGGDGIGFAIASDRVKVIADQLIQHGRVVNTGRAFLGIQPGNLSDGRGVLVADVVRGGPAASAGIRTGDVLTAVGGKATPAPADLLAALATKKPGDTVTVTLRRSGDRREVKVKLGELPATQD